MADCIKTTRTNVLFNLAVLCVYEDTFHCIDLQDNSMLHSPCSLYVTSSAQLVAYITAQLDVIGLLSMLSLTMTFIRTTTTNRHIVYKLVLNI